MTRPSWDEYFIEMTDTVAKRATCDRGRSGSVIVRENRILTTGYVGSPPGLPHCDEVGHLMKQVMDEDGKVRSHCMRTIHAEQNAICQAARHGISLAGATLYCTMEPCRVCAMLIISVGIRRVVAKRRYHAAQETREMFAQAGIQLDVIEDVLESYENQAPMPQGVLSATPKS
ncbi:MAG: cytidine/deoxycytidylate deaminase family protein [Rhodospirillales bacterium]|nr:cytidine/deoxycytidylate deaminase family protein [Rhodospirillales bacterium]